MKKTLITIISALAVVAMSATMAVATTTAPRLAARSNVSGASPASSGVPTICPPAKAVGSALGLTVSKPTVVMYAKGLALECKYMSKKGKTTLSYSSATRTAFLAMEKALPKTSIVVLHNLGSGVAAYLLPPNSLFAQEGTVECVIETEVSAVHQKALAKVLLKSYW